MSKFINLYTLNMCCLLYIDYITIKKKRQGLWGFRFRIHLNPNTDSVLDKCVNFIKLALIFFI